MKRILSLGVLAALLTACGGGGGGDSYSSNDNGQSGGSSEGGESTKVELTGLYSGETNRGQSVVGLVDKNNKYWFFYTAPYANGIAGVVSGDLAASGAVFKSTNSVDYNFEGQTIYKPSIEVTAETKKFLNGSISYNASNTNTFKTQYDLEANKTISKMSDVVGTFNGSSIILQGSEKAVLYISTTGKISGRGASGCTFSGNITPVSNTPYFKLNLVFGFSPCYMSGQAINGVSYFDPSDNTLMAVGENSGKQNSVLFYGLKQ
ncbi:hypothetical protein [Acinetobacter sp. Marseille-Q1618]|uniref:hypothetical protein n=1 Tax=Acinetobacter sp. Marseille-Q1618 TaxID=2697502 RepID=UPI00156FABC2|nr:hypothetical protein [Acinetobacter sp. Marseille-Q1618]